MAIIANQVDSVHMTILKLGQRLTVLAHAGYYQMSIGVGAEGF